MLFRSGAEPLGTGHGATKQEAEQDAARAALETLVGKVSEAPGAKQAKTSRTRRAPRKPREPREPREPLSAAQQPEAEMTAEVVPLHALGDNHEPSVAEPRSRQFGEPIE